MLAIRHRLAAAALFATLLIAAAGHAETTEPERLVERARITVESLAAKPEMAEMRGLLSRARAVLVFPQVLKAGFIVGGQGGSGVLLGRDPQTGAWTAPAFYTMGAGSIGLQMGAEASELVLLVMNDKALTAVIANQVKLGADATIAVGPIGMGVGAATTTALAADIYSFSSAKGLFGGATLEGAVIYGRDDWNRVYYGAPYTAADIVIRRQTEAPAAAPLQQALQRAER